MLEEHVDFGIVNITYSSTRDGDHIAVLVRMFNIDDVDRLDIGEVICEDIEGVESSE